MFVGDARNPVDIPQQDLLKLGPQKNVEGEPANNGIDFDKMLSLSNDDKKIETDKEKNAMGGGEFHVGETKNDKDFREQLEKITGKKMDTHKTKLDQNDFLTLLVTQLKYQDPSKPMEHYEMASQMAQFNTVEQLVGANKSLSDLTKVQQEAKADKLSQYLEKYVEVQGAQMKLNSDHTTTTARFSVPSKTAQTTLEIKDPQGKVVRSIPLGSLSAGTHNADWDGKDDQGRFAAAGDYTFNVLASAEDGKPLIPRLTYLAKVNGVTELSTGGKLDTSAGVVDPAQILSIRNYETKGAAPHVNQ